MKLRRKNSELRRTARTVEVAAIPEVGKQRFNPQQEITANDHDQIDQELERLRLDDIYTFALHAEQWVNLFPEKRRELELSDAEYHTLRRRRLQAQGLLEYARQTVRLLTLFPDKRDEIIDKDLFERLQSYMEENRSMPHFSFYGAANANLRLHPDRRDELNLEPAFQRIYDDLQSYNGVNVEEKACRAWGVVMLYPDRRQLLQLTDAEFHQVKQTIDKYRKEKDWYQFLIMVQALAVLTADEVALTDQGFRTMFHDLVDEQPTLPERRIA